MISLLLHVLNCSASRTDHTSVQNLAKKAHSRSAFSVSCQPSQCSNASSGICAVKGQAQPPSHEGVDRKDLRLLH